jgi:DNA gyrase inhibitor GyrI
MTYTDTPSTNYALPMPLPINSGTIIELENEGGTYGSVQFKKELQAINKHLGLE